MSTNLGRIAYMGARAKRLYKPLTLATVPDTLRGPAVVVSIEPSEPSGPDSNGAIDVAAPIEHVVLKSKTRPDVALQPTGIEMEPVEWTNLLGGKVSANRAVAFFDHATVDELPAGEFDIVVITPNGERRCKVGNNDRNRLFPRTRR